MFLAPVGLLFFLFIFLLPIVLFLNATKFFINKGADVVKGQAANDMSVSTRKCPNCNAVVSSSYKYCPFCNTRLQKECIKCGMILNPAWKHCPACGQEN